MTSRTLPVLPGFPSGAAPAAGVLIEVANRRPVARGVNRSKGGCEAACAEPSAVERA